MASEPERSSPPTLSEVLRRRLRARAAEELLSHEEIARRITGAGLPMGRRKVSHVIAGQVRPQLDELRYWAAALNTTEAYLLGFTWDPRPGGASPAGNVAAHTPGWRNQPERRLSLVTPGQDLPRRAHLRLVHDSARAVGG